MGAARAHPSAGQATVEYTLLIAMGAVAVIGAMLWLAGGIDRIFSRAADSTGEVRPVLVDCDASYVGGCVPPGPPDLDCDDLAKMGVPLPVQVVGGDPHKLDGNDNGFGCDE
jgi:Flp pilus assembly pilin Flp